MKDKILEELEGRVRAILPDEQRRAQGPYALFECFESIPCNPCYTSCKFHAVKPLEDINELPETYYDKCTGCGVCITACPGLAAFVIDETFSSTESLIKIPYEYFPRPQKGEQVEALDRMGRVVGRATVQGVVVFKNKTAVVSISVPKELTHVVRGIRTAPREQLMQDGCMAGEMGESIVCRCEDVTEAEIRDLTAEGHTSIKQIKLRSRASMGPCQGRTCLSLILRELAADSKKSINEILAPRYRQPAKPTKIGAFLDAKDAEKE